MQYSPKLKKAMEEIKAVLKKHDIAASVILHTPGHSEHLIKIDPSYSCARFEGDNVLRVRSKIAEYNGNKQAQLKQLSDTANMLKLLTDTIAHQFMMIEEVEKKVTEVTGAEYFDGGYTSQNTQDN